MNGKIDIERTATVVITHKVTEASAVDYEAWLQRIVPLSKTYPGHLGVQVIQGPSSVGLLYTIVIRFDTKDHLLAWTHSQDRKRLVAEAQSLLVDGDSVNVIDGLDFWFAQDSAPAKMPKKWKQFLVTWSAIYPLVFCFSWGIGEIFRALGIPHHSYLSILIVTGLVVGLMTYVVMPRYTKAIHRWLFA